MDYFALDSAVYNRLMRWYRLHESKGLNHFGVWTIALDRCPEAYAFCIGNEVGDMPCFESFEQNYQQVLKELEKPLGILVSLAKPRDEVHAGMIRKAFLDDHVAVGDLLNLPMKEYATLSELSSALSSTGARLNKTLDKIEAEYYGY